MLIHYPAERFITGPVVPKNLEARFKEKKPKNIIPLFSPKIVWWKRMIDLTGAFFGILFLLPLFAIIAWYIKIISPGPVLFKQKRIGFGGDLFNCLKFRTMKPDADPTNHRKYLSRLINGDTANTPASSSMTKLHDDPQIIPFGNLIRETGLDELPQLINVIRGEMSLIGPRPPIPYEVEQYPLWFNDRFDVLPGLTGLWQVSGKNRLSFNEMIRLDIQYVRRKSFLLDMKIFLLTPYALMLQVKDYLVKKLSTRSYPPIQTTHSRH